MAKYNNNFTKALCFYCGCQMTFNKNTMNTATVDHKLPISRGGIHDLENNVMCCKRCNNDKSHLTFDEYRLVMAYRRHEIDDPSFLFFGEVHPDKCLPKIKGQGL